MRSEEIEREVEVCGRREIIWEMFPRDVAEDGVVSFFWEDDVDGVVFD